MRPPEPSWGIFAEVRKTGPLIQVQDLGRWDHLRDGVPIGGAYDPFALKLANCALGNAEAAAGLEILGAGLIMRITRETELCVAGRGVRVQSDGHERPLFEPFSAQDEVKIVTSGEGRPGRSYLAVRGGIAVKPVLGSRSTYLPGGFGGFRGRALKTGDRLYGFDSPSPPPSRDLRRVKNYLHQDTGRLSYTPHHSPSGLSHGWIEKFLTRDWRVNPQSSRMGIRLEPGEKRSVGRKIPNRLLSQGVFPGVIQLPPDLCPILLGADAQTIGGYPIVGTISAGDLWKLGQLMPGDRVRLFRQEYLANS